MSDASSKLRLWMKGERQKAKMTMRELATCANCTHTTIGELEKGNRKMGLNLAEKIAQAFGKKLNEVLKELEV